MFLNKYIGWYPLFRVKARACLLKKKVNIINNKKQYTQLYNNSVYNEYYEMNSNLYGKLNQPSPEFLTWLIGFSEGDGSFVRAKRGDLYFVITQDTRDIQVLYLIQKELNMGKVIKQGKTTSRFIIQDLLGLYLISLIFNGQIRTPEKLKSYIIFVNKLNDKINKGINTRKLKKFGFTNKDNLLRKININIKLRDLSLTDNWLAGFVDAEGCFHVSFLKNKMGFNILFDITQKGKDNKEIILEKLVILFKGGRVSKHHKENNWSYRIDGLYNVDKIINYFNKENNILYTKKYNSYFLWKYIQDEIKKRNHIDPISRQKLINLSHSVNKYSENVGKN